MDQPQNGVATTSKHDGVGATDMSKLVIQVTQNIDKVMDQKLSKLTNSLDKISSSLGVSSYTSLK